MTMMTILHRGFLKAEMLISTISALAGCAQDPGIDRGPEAPMSVTMNLTLPSPTTLQTYALDDDRENEVSRLDVFILNEAGRVINNVGHQTIRSFGQSGIAITAQVAIDRSVPKQQFYIIANGTDALFDGVTTKAQLDALEISSLKMPRQLFVMSASSGLLAVADLTANLTFSLIRCVARIDVKLDKTKVTNFKIKSAKLINVRSGSYLYQKKSGGVVTFPAASTMLDYDPVVMTQAEEFGFAARLYAYENYNADPKDADHTTSITLGGDYGNSGTTTYYQIDVKDNDQKLHIMRNNRYDITINQVDGPGFATEDDAQTGANANLHYSIEVWKQSDVNSEFDGTISLGVSDRQIQIPREAYGGTIIVETNADTFGVTSPVDASGRPATWLGLVADDTVINYTATANYTGSERTAYFYVTAGSKLKIKVSVTQVYGDLSIVKLSATSVAVATIGTGAAPASMIITSGRENVTWTLNPVITKFGDHVSDWVDFVAGQQMTGTGTLGEHWEVKVNVAPMADIATPSRSAIVQITAKDNTSGVVEHYKFTVVQLNNADVVLLPERFYLAAMGGRTTIALPVKSNSTWTATFHLGNGHITTLQSNDFASPPVYFQFAADVNGVAMLPDEDGVNGKTWHTYTASGDDVLYVHFVSDLRNMNQVLDGYLQLKDASGSVVRRVRLHQGDYQDVEVNGLHILDRNLGATYAGAGNRTTAHTADQKDKASGYRYQWGRIPDGYETRFAYGTVSTAVFNGIVSTFPTSCIPMYSTLATMVTHWSYVVAGNNSWISVNSDTPLEQRSPGSFWDKNAVLSTAASDIDQTNPTGVRTNYDPCPEGYRVPTALELKQIFLSTQADHPSYNPVSDYVANQFGRWILESKTGMANDVYFPASGASIYLSTSGYYSVLSTAYVGSNTSYGVEGYYMSSSPAGAANRFHYLFFDKNKIEMRSMRHQGTGASFATGLLSVRCVRN